MDQKAQQLLVENKDAELQKLFNDHLPSNQFNVELWRVYIKWVAKSKDQKVAMDGFDAALNAVGWLDGNVWTDVLEYYLKWTMDGKQGESTILDKTRQVFQQAVTTPTDKITELWNKYNQFESARSGTLAHKFIADKSAQYMTARLAIKERNTLLSPIFQFKKSFSKKKLLKFTDRDCLLILSWKQYLEWESNNPMGLDDANLIQRLGKAYLWCFDMMTYFSHFYIDAFREMNKRNQPGEHFLKAGLDSNPDSLTLSFHLAHHLQITKKNPMSEIKDIFTVQIEHFTKKAQEITDEIDKQIEQLQQTPVPTEPEEMHKHNQSIEKSLNLLEKRRSESISPFRNAVTLCFIVYMRFARREGVKEGRNVYASARKHHLVNWQLHVASALMEYYCTKDSAVASRLFESVLKLYSQDHYSYSKVTSCYLDFLIACNNDTNARALFERSIALLEPQDSVEIKKQMMLYEQKYGDTNVLEKLELRMDSAEFLENLSDFSTIYSYMDIDLISQELGLGKLLRFKERVPKFKSALLSTNFAKQNIQFEDKEYENAPAMTSVQPAKYPRPDFSKWKMFKIDDDMKAQAQKLLAKKPVVPAPNSTAPAPVQNDIQLPPLVVSFIQKLPPSLSYNGPAIIVNELLQVIYSLNVPVWSGDFVDSSSELLKSGSKRRLDASGPNNSKRHK